MNYEILDLHTGGKLGKKRFIIKETKTHLYISEFDNYCEAKMELRRLNLGGGFDGFTPSFMINSQKIFSVTV